MTPEIAQTYFAPLTATKERAELLRGFGAAVKSRAQMVALAGCVNRRSRRRLSGVKRILLSIPPAR